MIDSDDSSESMSCKRSDFFKKLKLFEGKRKQIREELIRDLPSQESDYMLYDEEPVRHSPSILLQHRTDIYYQLHRLKAARLHFSAVKDIRKVCDLLNAHGDTLEERINLLRSMHQSLSFKREVLDALENEEKTLCTSSAVIPKTKILDNLYFALKNIWFSMCFDLSLCYPPINTSLKLFFGSEIVSLFSVCWNFFLINSFNFIVVLLLLVIPQLIYNRNIDNKSQYQTKSYFSLMNILNGKGWFVNSTFYNGGYTNETLEFIPGIFYSMPMAYILTIIMVFLLNFIIIIRGLLYFGGEIKIGKSQNYSFAEELFSHWDYSIGTQGVADFMKVAFYDKMRSFLYKENSLKTKLIPSEVRKIVAFMIINSLAFILAVGSCYAVLKLLYIEDLFDSFSLVASALLIGLPIIYFYSLKFIEIYNFCLTEKTLLYTSIIRLLMLRVVLMSMVFYFWVDVFKNSSDTCHQTEMSSLIFRLTIGNFFLQVILYSCIAEYMRRKTIVVFNTYWGRSHFDLAYHTVDVLHYQFLGWVGLLWVPLIPLLNSFVLFLLFFLKSNSILQNCKPMKVVWSSDEVKKFKNFLTLVTFLFSILLSGYSLFKTGNSSCGPFRDWLDKMALLESIFMWRFLQTYPSYTWSHSLLLILTLAMCTLVAFLRSYTNHAIFQTEVYEKELRLIIEDKTFLLQGLDNLLNDENKRNK